MLGILLLKNSSEKICIECLAGKQVKAFQKSIGSAYKNHVLELLHLDLKGHMQIESLGGKKYAFVVVDDFLRYM